MKISLICVYNNEIKLKEQLLASLSTQEGDIERILLDSKKYNFKSAAEALNYGAAIATGDILIFSHQDISFKDKYGLKKFAEAISKTNIGDITGVVGVRDKSRVYYGNLTDGEIYNDAFIKDYAEELIKVSTVDEAMFGMKMETWKCHRFDEYLCDNWHLYAVEASLYARKNGYDVWVFPIQVHHFSHGKISLAYMNGLKRLCEAYRRDFKYIWTTCYKVRTDKLYITALVFIWTLNRKIRGRNY